MKLKIDENLPVECAVDLRTVGLDANTVFDEHLEVLAETPFGLLSALDI